MKKTISIILAIMMVATLSVSAFAAVTTIPNADSKATVTGYYVAGEEGAPEYCIDVKFGNMVFKYTDADQVWNEAEDVLAWEEAQNGEWAIAAAGEDKITVKNRSSETISAQVGFEAEDGFDGEVTGGECTNVATGATKEATLAITAGKLTGTDTVEDARTLGELTVTLGAEVELQ